MRREGETGPPRVVEDDVTVRRPVPEVLTARAPQTGALIGGRYRVEGVVGTGGGGVVLRARDTVEGRAVALKIATASHARSDREARLLSSLRHPAIVEYLDRGFAESGAPYLVMELLEGETLRTRLARGPLDAPDACRLVARILGALDYAHHRGIVHRDVKPSNVFLPQGDWSQAKLLDFGVATELADFRGTLTGQVIGTHLYMAPEQAGGDREIDGRADIFSAGCVLVECITGRPVFAGQGLAGFAKLALSERIVEERLRDLPSELAECAVHMLRHGRDQRPRSAAAMADRLCAVAETLPSHTVSQSRPPALGHRETRSLVVLLAGPLAQDAERVSDQKLARLAETWNAELQRLPSGASLLVFGVGSPRDQAVRAARAALHLRAESPQRPLALTLARATVERQAVVGPAIDETTRLIALPAAADDGAVAPIRVDRRAAELLAERFEVRRHRDDEHTLVCESSTAEAPRLLLGRAVPFVGRARELADLEAFAADCFEQSRAAGALVVAPAGGGKSRLRRELMARLDDVCPQPLCLIGEPDALRAGAPFGLLAGALSRAAGIDATEGASARREKFSTFLLRIVGDHASTDDRRRMTDYLGALVGASPEGIARATGDDPTIFANQVRLAWMDFIEAALTNGPVLVVFEDLHWGDAPSVHVAELALRAFSASRLCVLGLGRPEVEERFAGFVRGPLVKRFELSPLRDSACRALVQSVCPQLSRERLDAVVARAQGNPFFLEELVRSEATGDDASGAVAPPSVLAVVQARLDRVGEDGKRVLRAASIFGENFRRTGVESLLERHLRPDVGRWLDVLFERELILPRATHRQDDDASTVAEEWLFRHALVRDAAYDTLTEEDRRTGHRLAGEFMERVGERDALVIADHFERGGANERAAVFLRMAAEQALEASDYEGTLERCRRAELLGAAGEELGRVKLAESRAHWFGGRWQLSEDSAAMAVELLARPALWAAQSIRMEALYHMGRLEDVLRLHTELLEEAPRDGDSMPWAQAVVEGCLAVCAAAEPERVTSALQAIAHLTPRGDSRLIGTWSLARAMSRGSLDHRERIAECARAIECFRAAGDLGRLFVAMSDSIEHLIDLGRLEDARVVAAQLFREASRIGHFASSFALMSFACIELARSSWRAAEIAIERAAADQHVSQWSGACAFLNVLRAQCALAMSDPVRSLEFAELAVSGTMRDSPAHVAAAEAALARALLMVGQSQQAHQVAMSALKTLEAKNFLWHGEYLVWTAAVESAIAVGAADLARATAERALRALQSRFSVMDVEDRAPYIAAQPDLLRLARTSRALGVIFPLALRAGANGDPPDGAIAGTSQVGPALDAEKAV